MHTSKRIRQEFIAFFEEKGHHFVRSSPVVPLDDPSLLFINAGMNQFKDVFLGTGSRDYRRAVNSQKCIRASGKHNDLEDVGRDNYHHTFFEMLGNWSFGDYFKQEAIGWAWELLVERWGLPADKLYATVFSGSPAEGLQADTEAQALWTKVTPLPPERVLLGDKKDNFWEMGDTGPCGPCSEVHMDLGEGNCPLGASGQHVCAVNVEGCWRFIELWNLVFIQYNRIPGGNLEPLPARHVDTGMGLERIVRVLQGKSSNYDTDLFTPILAAIADLGASPDGAGEVGVAYRVIADHLRSLSFALADGALPSNEGRGYVLRRMLRRAARFGKVLGFREPFIHQLVPVLGEVLGQAFPEILSQAGHVARVIQAEEEGFAQTLERGLEMFEKTIVALGGEDSPGAAQRTFSGDAAFKLYDTYGFPVDLTSLMASERGYGVDLPAFERLMEAQRARGKAASQTPVLQEDWRQFGEGAHSRFVGYGDLATETTLFSASSTGPGCWRLVLAETPFYPEGGGQVADQGTICGEGGPWRVLDVQKEGDRIVHFCEGKHPPQGGPVRAEVDPSRRGAVTLNHTATHLLHRSLREVLGEHVHQAGSVVHPDYLRFDYTHFEKPGADQLEAVERRVNAVIRGNTPLRIYETGYAQAVADGVTAFFGEKYGDRVRVVEVPAFGAELCGGCHVAATGEIGLFQLASESGIAAGVRRITAYTGERAEENLRRSSRVLEGLKARLNVALEELPQRLDALLESKRILEAELKLLKKSDHAAEAKVLLAQGSQVEGITLIASQVEIDSMPALRGIGDALRREMERGIALLAAVMEGKGALLCVVSEALVRENVKAGDIVNQVAAIAAGRGGGPPHMATAGLKEIDKLPEALGQGREIITTYLKTVPGMSVLS